MSTIVTRAGKGTPLTNTEVDANFTNLNTDKYQSGGALGTPASGTLTNCTGLPQAGVVNLTTDLAAKAPLASPTFTGVPAAPTAAVDTNTTQLATTGFVIGQGYLKSATATSTYVSLSGSYANPSWITSLSETKVLPSQAAANGLYLTSNGTSTSWAAVPSPNNGTLTLAVSGTGLSGSASFTANQSGASTFTVTSNATSANTASTIVARDASGNFTAGTITAALSGNATTATTATNLSGGTVSATTGAFSGATNIGAVIGSTRGTALSVSGSNGSSPVAAKSGTYATVFSVLPWSGGSTYIGSGVYYDNNTWVHASDNTYNCLFVTAGNVGANWYASSNSTASWNLASNVSLWDSAGVWKSAVNTTSSVTAASFSGAGTGLTGTAASLSIGGNAATATNATYLYGSTNLYISPSNLNTLNSGFANAADNSDIWINYRGYNDGFSYFRDFRVGNGKGTQIALFTGSTGNLSITGAYSGAGTGLTGTASSLSIGGNAATATTATNVSGGTVSATTGSFSANLLVGTGTALAPSSVAGFGAGTITDATSGFSAQGICFGSGAGGHAAIVYGAGTMYFGTETGTTGTMATRFQITSAGAMTVSGSITATGNITANSDERLKENIELIPDALAKVESIRGVQYTWKKSGLSGIGVIAQDIRKIAPEAIMIGEDGMMSVAYGNLVGLLVEAVKDLSSQVKELKAKVGN